MLTHYSFSNSRDVLCHLKLKLLNEFPYINCTESKYANLRSVISLKAYFE